MRAIYLPSSTLRSLSVRELSSSALFQASNDTNMWNLKAH
jgi:hypothetical protein